ncbi:MAG: helix-turn-helix domain-containing protein [Planctomycetota bacterium]|jgi:DNA-binding IclR family transcriptional regulator|nr:helix-turn-helix domain-containing protein [Planctomycetota bacterium]
MASSPGLRHAIAIIELLAQEHQGQSFTTIRDTLGVQAPTASRILKVLLEESCIEKTTTGLYCLGTRMASMAQRFCGGSPLVPLVEPLVEELAQASGESAAYVEWGASGITFRAKQEMPESYHYMAVGHTNGNPLTNGFGQLCLAWFPEELERFGDARQRRDLEPRLATIRSDGYHETEDIGLRIVAPVIDATGRLAGAIGVSSLRFDMSRSDRERLRALVLRQSQRASEAVRA